MDSPACCCGDRIARLARDHAGRLAAIARAEGANPADALDLVQDAFQLLLGRSDFRALCERPDEVAPLLATIVRNAARNLRRRHHNARPHVPIDEVELAVLPEATLGDALEAAQLEGCLAQLGEVHRHVVTLRVLEELSGDEAAQALGVTPGHVAVLLHRARKQLERCMQG
ncbi:MAG TPA: sigma-70 family RNA polymerase sigma factor [Kofleriaceae bacterium]